VTELVGRHFLEFRIVGSEQFGAIAMGISRRGRVGGAYPTSQLCVGRGDYLTVPTSLVIIQVKN
jgi:hypothetical protein